jgi:starch-binding outer membrane protein, SusD/RagB family
MRRSIRVLLGLGLALGAAGCSDFLSGPGVGSNEDPNNIITLTKPGPLYVSIQQALAPQREGNLARLATMYTQQAAGVARQYVGFDRYQTAPGDIDSYFAAVYGASNNLTGGGSLLDIHKMQQLATKANDNTYLGIAKIYEAMVIGFAADIWGDIPYREAADSTIKTPQFDGQLQVYDDMQKLLDDAIGLLQSSNASDVGGALDGSELIYAGRSSAQLRTVYTKVAHSLKARYYMHVAATNPAAYALALSEAQLGIDNAADDFLLFHDASSTGTNVWWQFNAGRAGDVEPGAALIAIMKNRIAANVEDAQRLYFYFTSATGDTLVTGAFDPAGYFGHRPGGAVNLQTTGGIDNGNGAGGDYSSWGAFIDPNVGDGSFRQPELTYAETQLIAAEATWHINCAACAPSTVVGAAQPFLDAARTNRHYGAQGGGPVTFGPSGPAPYLASLQNIMEEKYVTLFLNPEVWNDYKRTCLPSLASAPAAGATTPGTAPIAGRLPYGLTEINANPNVPTTSSAGQPITAVGLNPNQPNACPVLNYTSSTPLAN